MTGDLHISRILLTRMKYIGDVVLTTPIIRAVRERYPDAFIAYLGDQEAVSLLRNNPHLNEIIPFEFSRPTLLEQPRIVWLLRKRKFDVVVDFFGNPRSALVSYLSGAPMRIGGAFGSRGKLFTHRIRDDGNPKTAVQFHAQYVKPLEVDVRSWKTEIFLTEDERRAAKIYLQWQDIDLSRPLVGLHPGATWPAKLWPAERFAQLANMISTQLDAHVLITQGPKDGGVIVEIGKKIAWWAKILPAMPLRQLAAIVSHCSVYVSNDAAPMHIAVAVDTPTIGIFGPGEEDIWFPYLPPYYPASSKHAALRKDVFCHPCHLKVCNRQGDGYMECMTLLSVEEVYEAVRKRLEIGS